MLRRVLIALLSVCGAPASLAAESSAVTEHIVTVSAADSSAQSPDVAIGPDGSINVVWLGEKPAAPNAAQIAARGHSHDSKTNLYFARSVDGGKTYSAPLRINRTDGDVWGFAISKPRIAAGPDGRTHILFPGNVHNPATGNTETLALYTRSDSNARQFEEPRRLNVDALADNIAKDDGGAFATIAVDLTNTVYAAWVDTRTMSEGDMGRLAIAVSRNGGAVFEADKIVLSDIVCPCCQLTSAVDGKRRLLLGIRLVEDGYRDSAIIALRQRSTPGMALSRRRRPLGNQRLSAKADVSCNSWQKFIRCVLLGRRSSRWRLRYSLERRRPDVVEACGTSCRRDSLRRANPRFRWRCRSCGMAGPYRRRRIPSLHEPRRPWQSAVFFAGSATHSGRWQRSPARRGSTPRRVAADRLAT